jgi:hypothetical protein
MNLYRRANEMCVQLEHRATVFLGKHRIIHWVLLIAPWSIAYIGIGPTISFLRGDTSVIHPIHVITLMVVITLFVFDVKKGRKQGFFLAPWVLLIVCATVSIFDGHSLHSKLVHANTSLGVATNELAAASNRFQGMIDSTNKFYANIKIEHERLVSELKTEQDLDEQHLSTDWAYNWFMTLGFSFFTKGQYEQSVEYYEFGRREEMRENHNLSNVFCANAALYFTARLMTNKDSVDEQLKFRSNIYNLVNGPYNNSKSVLGDIRGNLVRILPIVPSSVTNSVSDAIDQIDGLFKNANSK